MILNKVRETIKDHDLIQKGDKIVLGISGGPDSVCLLHLLCRLKEEFDIDIYAAHLNHQIRGLDASLDALYVSKLCKEMGVAFFVKSIDIPAYCKEAGLSVEDGARKKRYEMFYELKEEIGADKIAIAHNMNDQAETILMRMMRGTGIQGLRGIEYERDDVLIRPLLDIPKSEVLEYCSKNSLEPRIDKTNLETVYTRNKIRLKLIPYMSDNFNSNVVESIVRMGNNIRVDSDFIERETMKAYSEILSNRPQDKSRIEIDLEIYSKLDGAIKSRIVRHAIKDVLGDTNFMDQVHIEQVMSLEPDSKLEKMIVLPRGMFAYRKKGSIILTSEEIIEEKLEFCYNVPCNGFIKIRDIGKVVKTEVMGIERFKSLKVDKGSKGFDLNRIKGGIVIRNRQPGDKIKLAMGNKKIKDLFIDMKIPKEDRCRIPIVLDEEGVMCVGDFRISEDYKISDTTREVLRITFANL
ncbi:MAG: tRNA lysidine(34) synthetase TilS [Clostridioides sp.]|nr:tRNA lysidine(34) synthetase TilS [Clostridioides sp.]